ATLAQARERSARAGARAAADKVSALAADEARARRSFEEARDALVSLGPPPAERTDLASDWRQLVAWVVTKRSEVEAGATAAASEATLLGREHGALKAEVDQWCADGGVAPAGRPPSEAVAVARAQ